MVIPFASRATQRIARKTPSRKGCVQIERSLCRTPWHCRPGYNLRRASRDHLDFPSNTAHVRLVQGFPKKNTPSPLWLEAEDGVERSNSRIFDA